MAKVTMGVDDKNERWFGPGMGAFIIARRPAANPGSVQPPKGPAPEPNVVSGSAVDGADEKQRGAAGTDQPAESGSESQDGTCGDGAGI